MKDSWTWEWTEVVIEETNMIGFEIPYANLFISPLNWRILPKIPRRTYNAHIDSNKQIRSEKWIQRNSRKIATEYASKKVDLSFKRKAKGMIKSARHNLTMK